MMPCGTSDRKECVLLLFRWMEVASLLIALLISPWARFNASEAMQVVHYLRRAFGPWGLLPSEVGVLTPYRRQTLKLRELVNSLGLPACKIGSAEEFQGQERRLIVVSTVSRPRPLCCCVPL